MNETLAQSRLPSEPLTRATNICPTPRVYYFALDLGLMGAKPPPPPRSSLLSGQAPKPGCEMRPYGRQERKEISSQLDRHIDKRYIRRYEVESIPRPLHTVDVEYIRKQADVILGAGNWTWVVVSERIEHRLIQGDSYDFQVSCRGRVTLQNGSFREDVGFGHETGDIAGDNRHILREAFMRCCHFAERDALKRAMHQVGRALGGSLYDREFLASLDAQ